MGGDDVSLRFASNFTIIMLKNGAGHVQIKLQFEDYPAKLMNEDEFRKLLKLD